MDRINDCFTPAEDIDVVPFFRRCGLWQKAGRGASRDAMRGTLHSRDVQHARVEGVRHVQQKQQRKWLLL